MLYQFAGYFSLAASILLCYMALRDRSPILSEQAKGRNIMESYRS